MLYQDCVLSQMYVFKENYYTVRYLEYLLIFVFLSLLMKFVSNFNFYAHHIISIIMMSIIIIILTILIFFKINNNYFSTRHLIFFVLFIFLNRLLESITYAYYEYLIKKKNISFYIVCFFYGSIEFIIQFKSFLRHLPNFNYKSILCSLALLMYFIGFNFFFYRTIYENSVIYGCTFYIYMQIIHSVEFSLLKYFIGYSIIIVGILILIFAFIYAEIIELNCCGLNKNTRRNILKRELEEKKDIDLNDSELKNDKIEISKGYYLEMGVNDQIEDDN